MISQAKSTTIAITSLGNMIKNMRLEIGLSQQNLAQRINVTRQTIIAIEKGNPKVAIGAVFEAAYILGIPLLANDQNELKNLSNYLSNLATVLPKRARRNKVDNYDEDF